MRSVGAIIIPMGDIGWRDIPVGIRPSAWAMLTDQQKKNVHILLKTGWGSRIGAAFL
jgi:hypothetical protein